MVRARSTVSIARTTPAQKPRGEQSTIFRGGLAGMGAIPDRITPEKGNYYSTWDGFWALSRPFSKPLRAPAPAAYIRRNSRLYRRNYRLRLQKKAGEAQR